MPRPTRYALSVLEMLRGGIDPHPQGCRRVSCANAVSGGEDSIVLLRLAEKHSAPGPFPVSGSCGVDTGHNFPEVIDRRWARRRAGRAPHCGECPAVKDQGRVVEESGPRASRNRLQTVTLLDAINEYRFDAARALEEPGEGADQSHSRRSSPGGTRATAPRRSGRCTRLGRVCACCFRTGPSSTCRRTSPRSVVPSILLAHPRKVLLHTKLNAALAGSLPATTHGALSHGGRRHVHRRG